MGMFTISAVYNWKGDVHSGLPLEIGETVQILEEHGGKCYSTNLILFLIFCLCYNILIFYSVVCFLSKDQNSKITMWSKLIRLNFKPKMKLKM